MIFVTQLAVWKLSALVAAVLLTARQPDVAAVLLVTGTAAACCIWYCVCVAVHYTIEDWRESESKNLLG